MLHATQSGKSAGIFVSFLSAWSFISHCITPHRREVAGTVPEQDEDPGSADVFSSFPNESLIQNSKNRIPFHFLGAADPYLVVLTIIWSFTEESNVKMSINFLKFSTS
jgi:hypothetical protein